MQQDPAEVRLPVADRTGERRFAQGHQSAGDQAQMLGPDAHGAGGTRRQPSRHRDRERAQGALDAVSPDETARQQIDRPDEGRGAGIDRTPIEILRRADLDDDRHFRHQQREPASDALRALRQATEPDGYAIMAAGARSLVSQINVWGAPRSTHNLMQRLKLRWDTADILNRGEFISPLYPRIY